MYNWNTDTSAFKTAADKRTWELIQLLDYGTQGKKIPRKELMSYWPKIEAHLEPAIKRLLEYALWGKLSSLPTNSAFWNTSSQLRKFPITST